MTDGLHGPVPNIDAYLDRIGISQVRKPTLEFLDEVIYAHQCNIPFDNLDICDKGLSPSLAKADLFDKIVVRKRGGYCFELNSLFFSLLQGLGFDVVPAMARVLLRPIPHPAITHRTSIVTIDNTRYLADVGFGGPMPGFAVALEDGVCRSGFGQNFFVHAHDDYWIDLNYAGSSEEERPVMRICMMPSEEQDFVALSFFQSQNPQSVFVTSRRANIRTTEGAVDLYNMTLTEYCSGQKTVVELADEQALDETLGTKFGICDWR